MDSKFLKKINTYDKILIQSDEDSQKIYSFYAREGKSNHFPFQTGNIDIKFGGTGILFEQVGDLLYNLDFYCHDESGKVVWIKPHKRNEGKDNSKQKIYMV